MKLDDYRFSRPSVLSDRQPRIVRILALLFLLAAIVLGARIV